jgi:hypothetical protein
MVQWVKYSTGLKFLDMHIFKKTIAFLACFCLLPKNGLPQSCPATAVHRGHSDSEVAPWVLPGVVRPPLESHQLDESACFSLKSGSLAQ